MNYRTFILLILLLPILSCLNNGDDVFPPSNNCIDGQGAIVTETRTVNDFHSINNLIVADIFLTQGPKEDIILEAQQNILDQLKTIVVNNELRLSFTRCVDIQEKVKIYISIPDIKNLTVTGVGDLVAQNDFNLSELNVVLTGVGDVILKGITSELNIMLTGVGNVKTFQFNTDLCDATLTGVGDIEVFVNDQLNVNLTGVGNVYYKGNPTISATITGSGSVVDAN